MRLIEVGWQQKTYQQCFGPIWKKGNTLSTLCFVVIAITCKTKLKTQNRWHMWHNKKHQNNQMQNECPQLASDNNWTPLKTQKGKVWVEESIPIDSCICDEIKFDNESQKMHTHDYKFITITHHYVL
jgi:hypothetical protein